MMLRKYFRPRTTIDRLQTLRTQLGLSRPKEEYEELLLSLNGDDTNETGQSPNLYEHLVGRKDGAVHIGSTPNDI